MFTGVDSNFLKLPVVLCFNGQATEGGIWVLLGLQRGGERNFFLMFVFIGQKIAKKLQTFRNNFFCPLPRSVPSKIHFFDQFDNLFDVFVVNCLFWMLVVKYHYGFLWLLSCH